MRVSRIFSKFQFCIGWGEGELQENFEKDLLFYKGIQKLRKIINTALLSQRLNDCSRIKMHNLYSRLVSICEPQCKLVVLPVICVNSWMFNFIF